MDHFKRDFLDTTLYRLENNNTKYLLGASIVEP